MSNSIVEDGVVAGNYEDKYNAKNPIARYLMDNFLRCFDGLLAASGAQNVHEVGCGEGELARRMARRGLRVRASDFSCQIVEEARRATVAAGLEVTFEACSIYELDPEAGGARLVVACEVLEHLERPRDALAKLAQLAHPYLLLSVPREPLWRVLNIARGKYISDLGNTPGHLQHWSRRAFLDFLREHLDIVETRAPVPWTMALCKRRTT